MQAGFISNVHREENGPSQSGLETHKPENFVIKFVVICYSGHINHVLNSIVPMSISRFVYCTIII